jgi:hypothetical protein
MKLQQGLQHKDDLKKKCRYDDSYLQFGFTHTADSNKPDTQSILYYQTLENSSIVSVKLQQNLPTKQVDCRDKPADIVT